MNQEASVISSRYGLFQSIWLFFCVVYTRLFFKGARLVRLPIFLRGRKNMDFGEGFTCGYLVRLDAFGVGSRIRFGRNVQLNDFVHIGAMECVDIGDNVLIASRVFITDHDHGIYGTDARSNSPSTPPADRPICSNPVIIGNNVWIGENVSILPGVKIGDGCIIGAGSVVKSSIPRHSIAVGVPATVVKRFDEADQVWVKVSRT